MSALVGAAEEICRGAVTYEKQAYDAADRRLDRILTSKRTGYPIMLLLLAFIFWLTITGANYPSQLLSDGLFWVQDRLTEFFQYINAPDWLHGVLVLGLYRVLAWVVSVMLPPMAIFFPLFTLLEDAGYLPGSPTTSTSRSSAAMPAASRRSRCLWDSDATRRAWLAAVLSTRRASACSPSSPTTSSPATAGSRR